MSTIDWLNLNWIDYAIIGIILLSLLIGVVRGFVCEIISLITWVAAFVLAFKFAAPAAAHLTFTDSATTRYVIAFAGIFILTLVIGITINVMIRHLWHRTGVPAADRILGLLLGIARGVVIIAFILLLMASSPLKDEPKVTESQLIPVFKPVVNWLHDTLPEKVVNVSEWTNSKKTVDNNSKAVPLPISPSSI